MKSVGSLVSKLDASEREEALSLPLYPLALPEKLSGNVER